ncbi:hypothetical protein COOONC_05878 [Cooperia oncophora]
MLRVIVLATVAFAVYAQYNYAPPATYGVPQAPPVQYYPAPLFVKPILLPELPPEPEFLIPERRHRRRDSESNESRRRDRCGSCGKIENGCIGSSTGNCFSPNIRFVNNKRCMAIASCGFGQFTLETDGSSVLSSGFGIEKVIDCKQRRWLAKNVTGSVVDVTGLRCIASAQPTQN